MLENLKQKITTDLRNEMYDKSYFIEDSKDDDDNLFRSYLKRRLGTTFRYTFNAAFSIIQLTDMTK